MNGKSMADKLGLGPEVRELKLGPTFSASRGTAFHTLRYDFKPASVDENKVATVDVGSSQQVTVTVPHLDGSGTMQTVFKGSSRPYQRECVIIIDKITGEITLEKLTNNIQLKKTRMEAPSKSSNSHGGGSGGGSSLVGARPATPTEKKSSPPQRQSQKPPKSLSMPLPKHSPLPASPSYTNKSPSVYKSPPQIPSSLSLSPVTSSGSLPMIGLEDPLENAFSSPNLDNLRNSPYYPTVQDQDEDQNVSRVGMLSDSSSNSSSDNDSSDSESGSSPSNNVKLRLPNGHVNGSVPPADVLKADLELSESGSDSDL